MTISLPTPVIAQSRADAAVESLTAYIAEVELAVGERLPSERDLSAALGVSRPILREALKHLAALGIVEAKTGSGTYLKKLVAPGDQHVVMQFESERQSLVQLLQLRRALEGEAAALTAVNADQAAISTLEQLVTGLEQTHATNGIAVKEDKAFHLALYRFSGNPLFEQVILPFWEMMERLKVRPSEVVDTQTLGHHRRTFNCIRLRDPEGARQTIHNLLLLVEKDLTSSNLTNGFKGGDG